MQNKQFSKILSSIMIIFSILALSCAGEKDGGSELITENDKVSYGIGTQIATGLKDNKIEINPEILCKALIAAFNDNPLEFSESEITETLTAFQEKMAASQGNDSTAVATQDEIDPELKDKVSYCIGVQIGSSLRGNSMDIDSGILSSGFLDKYEGKELKITEAEIEEVLKNFQERMAAQQQEIYNKMLVENLAAASAFLAENAKKAGVTTLPDSLQYEVVKEGSGPNPTLEDTVRAHYSGTFLDGTEFDSSYKKNEPIKFAVGQMIPGWKIIIPLMKAGSHWKVYIPSALGYGERGSQRVPPNSLLIFEIELLEIVK